MRKVLKKFLCFFMCVALCMLCACGRKKDNNIVETVARSETIYQNLTDETLWLTAYDIDTLNPIFSDSESLGNLSFLMYDSLFALDEKMKAVPKLADYYEISDGGMACIVYLKQGCKFHSGDNFGAKDVIYTISQIRLKGVNGRYHNNILNIKDVYESEGKLVFSLYTPEPLFVNNLCFPIIKRGTGEKIDIPNGTGPYKYVASPLTRAMYFDVNNDYFGEKPILKNAVITIVPSFENQIYALKYNRCDAVCVSNEELEKYNTGARRVQYNNRQLTFMGINGTDNFLSFSAARRAISNCIDREAIINEVLFGSAEAAILPYPRQSYIYPKRFNEIKKNLESATKELTDVGFEKGEDGIYVLTKEDGKKVRARVEILVNSENEKRVKTAKKIAENMATVGIEGSVVSVGFETYSERIAGGKYDLFIGETLLDNAFNTDLLFGPDARFSLCLTQSITDAILKKKSAIKEDDVTGAYSELCDALVNQVPLICLYFKNDAVLLGNRLDIGNYAVLGNEFSNINTWVK